MTSSSATFATSRATTRPTRPIGRSRTSARPSCARVVAKQARAAIVESLPELPESFTPEFERHYRRLRSLYWGTRQKYSTYLMTHDPELWRLLVPCDPVITVAPDCLFFECFSADESSYGCLTVDRGAFDRERDVALGTTNVDYSSALYEHFQSMRSYRETRFLVDPAGFEVQTEAAGDYREEKIELPPSWLRGFLQLQAAMTPAGAAGARRPRGSLQHPRVPATAPGGQEPAGGSLRARTGPLARGRARALGPPDPAERRSPTPAPRPETIRVWGRDRLKLLARLLPLAGPGRGLPARDRAAEFLGVDDGAVPAAAGALGLDRERLDGRLGAGPARTPRGAATGDAPGPRRGRFMTPRRSRSTSFGARPALRPPSLPWV